MSSHNSDSINFIVPTADLNQWRISRQNKYPVLPLYKALDEPKFYSIKEGMPVFVIKNLTRGVHSVLNGVPIINMEEFERRIRLTGFAMQNFTYNPSESIIGESMPICVRGIVRTLNNGSTIIESGKVVLWKLPSENNRAHGMVHNSNKLSVPANFVTLEIYALTKASGLLQRRRACGYALSTAQPGEYFDLFVDMDIGFYLEKIIGFYRI